MKVMSLPYLNDQAQSFDQRRSSPRSAGPRAALRVKTRGRRNETRPEPEERAPRIMPEAPVRAADEEMWR